MITKPELQDLLQSAETYRVERTTSTGVVPQDVPQGVPQDVPQGDTQDATQGDNPKKMFMYPDNAKENKKRVAAMTTLFQPGTPQSK